MSTQAPSGLADATRKVETIGLLVVRVRTDQGLEGVGITYHEVGGQATRQLILRDLKAPPLGRDPFETEALWHEFFHYLPASGRKGMTFCALSAVDIALWDLKARSSIFRSIACSAARRRASPSIRAAAGPPIPTTSSWTR